MRTIFTSALEGAWTGVGHQEMVWCHQVRWRVARAALELGLAGSTWTKGLVLDRWLRGGHALPSEVNSSPEFLLSDPDSYEALAEGLPLVLEKPQVARTYVLPITSPQSKFLLFVSQGSIPPVSPQNPLPLQADVSYCRRHTPSSFPSCESLVPTTLKLIPNPTPGQTFPVPHEGSDESDGVVLYEAEIPVTYNVEEGSWIGVRIAHADGRGWVVGGFSEDQVLQSHASTWSEPRFLGLLHNSY
jgi:glycosylphosphatidylinositol deacylase